MALPEDFNKIYGSTATGGLTPIGNVDYAKGWEFVGSNPPTKNDFSYLQNLSDRKSQWLYSNKLQRTDPFGDIKSDGAEAVSKALANLGLGGAAKLNVGTTTGTVAAGDDARFGKMLGVGQTPQDVTASRSLGVIYTNSTGKPIAVGVAVKGGDALTTTAYVNGVSYCYDSSTASDHAGNGVWFVVPDGMTYSVVATNTPGTIIFWTELR